MTEKKVNDSLYAAELIVKYLLGQLSDREKEELETWKQASENNQCLFESVNNPDELAHQLEELNNTDTQKGWQRVLDKIRAKGINKKSE
jgi:hypothetical protein